MKPVLLYTLPRTRGTAILYSCLRPIIKDEPFAEWALDLNSEESWHKALHKINDPKSVIKIHGEHISRDHRIEDWYRSVLEQNTHEVFVIERPDRPNIFLSHFIAVRLGFNLYDEVQPFEFAVNDADITHMQWLIEMYLKYFPSYGRVISLENLPQEFFSNKITPKLDQKSHAKYKYITNFDWAVEQIDIVINNYKEEWDNKVASLK